VAKALERSTFQAAYKGIETRNPTWNKLNVTKDLTYSWRDSSTYIQEPPFFNEIGKSIQPIKPINNARCLAYFGDSITTDHISPAGNISPKSPAGQFLQSKGVSKADFNSYGSRRGNDLIMTRGTFANIRLRNLLLAGSEGGVSRHFPDGGEASIFEVASLYQQEQIPSIILAGKDYGMGSSRDWAAKGVKLLGVQAVIAESYERIHRSNLVGMGVLPLQFVEGQSAASIGLIGNEIYSIDLDDTCQARSQVLVKVQHADGRNSTFNALVRIDSSVEITYFRHGGILQAVLSSMLT
jgi:aconitate hydratase